MIVAAALCASPPLLHPALTGRDAVLPELRAACGEAVSRLLEAGPEVVVVVGPASVTQDWDPDGGFEPGAFGPGAVAGRGGDGAWPLAPGLSPPGAPGLSSPGSPGLSSSGAPGRSLPLSLGLGVMLLEQGGYQGTRRLMAIGADEPAGACAAVGAELAAGATRTALLVMGDGSARRSPRAPGYLDPRAEPFDAAVEAAVRGGRLGALLELDEALARDLMATGRPAWQVLAGAVPEGSPVVEVLYRDDPFGVAYLVACVVTQGDMRLAIRCRRPGPRRLCFGAEVADEKAGVRPQLGGPVRGGGPPAVAR